MLEEKKIQENILRMNLSQGQAPLAQTYLQSDFTVEYAIVVWLGQSLIELANTWLKFKNK